METGIWTCHLRHLNCYDSRHMYYTRHQLCRLKLCASLAISGKIKKCRQLMRILSIWKKNFDGKIQNSVKTWKKTRVSHDLKKTVDANQIFIFWHHWQNALKKCLCLTKIPLKGININRICEKSSQVENPSRDVAKVCLRHLFKWVAYSFKQQKLVW